MAKKKAKDLPPFPQQIRTESGVLYVGTKGRAVFTPNGTNPQDGNLSALPGSHLTFFIVEERRHDATYMVTEKELIKVYKYLAKRVKEMKKHKASAYVANATNSLKFLVVNEKIKNSLKKAKNGSNS